MERDFMEIGTVLFDENSVGEFRANIQLEECDINNEFLTSDNFLIQNELLNNLFSNESNLFKTELKEIERKEKEVAHFSDKVIISNWKIVENISARIIEYYDNTVVLECLIDKDNWIYEEREFQSSLFHGYEIKIGNLFLLRIFERQNEIKIQIHNDPGLTLLEDFPKISFVESFQNSRLFKKK